MTVLLLMSAHVNVTDMAVHPIASSQQMLMKTSVKALAANRVNRPHLVWL
jgi:hypothetical protein